MKNIIIIILAGCLLVALNTREQKFKFTPEPELIGPQKPISYSVVFNGVGGKEIVKFQDTGEIYIRGVLVTNDLEVTKALKETLNAQDKFQEYVAHMSEHPCAVYLPMNVEKK